MWRKILNDEIKLNIYIGWDSREDIAYQVAKYSIEKHSSIPVNIIPLKQKHLRKQGLYWRDTDKLASTEFTFTRFLVPLLNDFKGWALFIDCDFVFLDDVKNLLDQADDKYALMCAQHDYSPTKTIKMDGQKQSVYPRKNWSSMMLINCGHPSNSVLDKEVVNSPRRNGAFFHRFSWLEDDEIGKISHEWNWLVGWYKEPEDGRPKALHYTEGGPWFPEYENCEYANEYYCIERQYLNSIILKLKNKSSDFEDLSNQKKNLINDILDYVIDPSGKYYKIDDDKLNESIKSNMTNKVAAIDSDGGIGYKKKNLAYDPYLQSFILGSGGYLSDWESEKDTKSLLIIRGLGSGSQAAIKHCWENNRDFFAIDTGYFGNNSKIKIWHRITKNNLQNLGPVIDRPNDRLKKIIDYQYQPKTDGKKILICPPSEKVMNLFDQPSPEVWTKQVIEELKKYTDRPIEIRLKPERTERLTTKTIESALEDDVYCLITYNSIAAIEAILNGKPAIALGPNAAQSICNTQISDIESLKFPCKEEMTAFMRHLSYAQFTRKEMLDGTAWNILNESN